MNTFNEGDIVTIINRNEHWDGAVLEVVSHGYAKANLVHCKVITPNPKNTLHPPGTACRFYPQNLKPYNPRLSPGLAKEDDIFISIPVACQCDVFNHGCSCPVMAWEKSQV